LRSLPSFYECHWSSCRGRSVVVPDVVPARLRVSAERVINSGPSDAIGHRCKSETPKSKVLTQRSVELSCQDPKYQSGGAQLQTSTARTLQTLPAIATMTY
jgi:hypothetical protein